jgi:CRISPR-associated endonuclease/helicase Cas3
VRCIVFCDKREDAQRALDVIQKRATGDKKAGVQPVDTCTELFVGGRRVYERQEAAQRLAKLGFLAGKRVTPTVPTFLFATSAAEVGVDLDADHMVCDLVAWERMIQRLGRVHRRGEPETHIANIVVLVEPQPEPKKNEREAIENRNQGKELDEREQKLVQAFEARVKKRRSLQAPLQQLPVQNGCRAASPGALRDLKKRATDDPVLRDVLDSATTPNPLRPAPSRALMDAWSMASLENHPGRPAVAPWLRGWVEDDPPQTAVVWRTFLPVRTGASVTRKELEVFFEAAPPHTSELLETETFRVVEWLVDRAMALLSRHSTIASEEVAADSPLRSDEAVAYVLASDGTPRKPNGIFRNPLRLGDLKLPEDKKAAKQRREDLNRLLAEATVVVDARLGGLKQGLLDTSENALPRTVDDGEAWLRESVAGFRVRSLDATESLVPDARWRERLRFAVDVSEDGEARRWLLIEKWRHTAATEEDRSAARPQLLDTHQRWAIKRAIRLGRRLGLTRDYRRMLGIAASLHDEGKRAKRWQRAFNAPPDGPYAKTRGPINYSLLDGYRHEFGSLAQAKQDKHVLALSESHRELLLHLIAAHHGFARPVISTTGCDGAPPSMLQERAQEVAMRFARLQAHWGPWGLAWWEALLRAADQMASRENDARDAGGGEG